MARLCRQGISTMTERKWKLPVPIRAALVLCVTLVASHAQTPSPALLVLEKSDHMLAIVDPASLKIVARVPVGDDPHEVATSSDGKTAYVTNYGAFAKPLHTLSVVDLVTQKPLPP